MHTLIDEISSLDWDIVPKENYDYHEVEEAIIKTKRFMQFPNKNRESWNNVLRSVLKDLLEIDAGVLVKVFDISSYDFDHLEPKSGAPLLKDRGERTMVEIYARDGSSFLKETDKFGFIKGFWQYSYQIPAHPMWFNRDEICYIMEHSRSMSTYGFARTQAVLDLVKSLHYSTLYNKRYFEEIPIPDGLISLKNTNEAEMKNFRDYWNLEFKNQPHKLAVVNKEVDWKPFNVSQRELEFLETQNWYFKLIISMFGLTPAELGLTDDLNRATSATQSELVKRKGIRPLLKLLENFINEEIISELTMEGIEFQFVFDDPGEKATRLANWKVELEMGVKTINDIRNEMGLEPVEWGNVPMMPNFRVEQQLPQSEAAIDSAEQAEAGNYTDERRRAEAETEVNTQVDNPFSIGPGVKPIGSVKSISMLPIDEDIKELADKYMFQGNLNQLKQGIEVEMEHAGTVGYDMDTIARIALDHLKEDPTYYTKLQEMEEEFKLNKRKNFLTKAYTKCRKAGGDKKKCSHIALKKTEERFGKPFAGYSNFKDCVKHNQDKNNPEGYCAEVMRRVEGKELKKKDNFLIGQYYSVPNQVIPFAKPPRIPLQDVAATNQKRDFNIADKVGTCPKCGHNTLTILQQPDEFPYAESKYQCTFCHATYWYQELLDQEMLADLENTMTRNTPENPQPAKWSPKAAKGNDLYLTFKEYVGFDFKSITSTTEFVNSKEYYDLLQEYLNDLPEGIVKKIISIIETGITNEQAIFTIKENINKILNDPLRAELIARTEVIRVVNEGKRQDMKDRGAKKVEWISAPEDGRLCKKCKALDGKIFTIKEIEGKIPLHPRCRCSYTEHY